MNMMLSSHQATAIVQLRRAGRACLRRLVTLLDADRPQRPPTASARPGRGEIFRRVQHEKWLGTQPPTPAAKPRHADLYKRPLIDLGDPPRHDA